jgi:hypothetical protein
MLKQLILLAFLAFALAENNTTLSNDSACNGAFFSPARFQKWGLQRPPYLSDAKTTNDMKYCKMFNGVNSCCDNATDNAIANYYNQYKAALANMTGGRMKKIKGVFETYKSISVDPNLAQVSSEFTTVLTNRVGKIKEKWVGVNQELVACARAALRMSIGLLCTGCSPKKSESQSSNGTLLLNRGACLNVSLNCMRLINSMKGARNESQDAAMALTDDIASNVPAEDVSSTSTASSDAGFFGDQSEADMSARRVLPDDKDKENGNGNGNDNGKGHEKDNDKDYEDPGKVINETIKMFTTAFPGLTAQNFILCVGNITDNATRDRCARHPLMPAPPNDSNMSIPLLERFKNNSKWAFVPVFVNITIKCPSAKRLLEAASAGLSTNYSNATANTTFELLFLFTHSKPNQDLLKFLLNKGIPCDTKLNKIRVTVDTIRNQLDQFRRFVDFAGDYSDMDKQIEDSSSLKANMNINDKLMKCIFAEIAGIFKTQNKAMAADNCSFALNITNEDKNVSICGQTVQRDVKSNLAACHKQSAVAFGNLSGTCDNGTCVVCLDWRCISLNMRFQKRNESADLNYSQSQGRQQFQKDPRVSLKTGKRVPDYIELPDTSFLTNMNYTAPCNDTNSCALWFCGKFLRGPVARIEKLYNPQDTDDADDAATQAAYASSGSARLLAESASSDVAVSETAGVEFNQVAAQSGLDASVTIDGESTAAAAYSDNSTNSTNNNNGNTNGGSAGSRVGALIAIVLGLLGLML